MSLLECPTRVLEHIASLLDAETLHSFALTSSRLRDVARCVKSRIRVMVGSERLERYLLNSGPTVRGLDFSHTKIPSTRMLSLIGMCPRITELNVVNSEIEYGSLMTLLSELTELQTLSCNVAMWTTRESRTAPNLVSIRKLYLEVFSSRSLLENVVRLINRCTAIEMVHVNLIGNYGDCGEVQTKLSRERWQTLHTFVCSCNLLTEPPRVSGFLQPIFAHNLTDNIRHWIKADKLCYIYEHGNLNGMSDALVNETRVRYVNIFHELNLDDFNIGNSESFTPARGMPQELRLIRSPLKTSRVVSYLNAALSPSLVVLDLTACHFEYSESVRWKVITDSPSLEVMALPLCFALFPLPKFDAESVCGFSVFEDRANHRRLVERFVQLWQTLKLKKLILQGDGDETLGCPGCLEAITSDSLGDLDGLEHLEELNFNHVTVSTYGYPHMANPKVKTIKLRLNANSNVSSLPSFIQRCTNLTRLKIESIDLGLFSADVWQAVRENQNVKQFCFAAGRAVLVETKKVWEHLLPIIDRVDIVHLHFTTPSLVDVSAFNKIFENYMLGKTGRASRKTVLYRSGFSGERPLQFCDVSAPYLGRSLCCIESFAAVVKTECWDTE